MLDEKGYEIPDNTPVEIPSRLRLGVSRAVRMRNFIRHELSRSAAESGSESFEEADDFSLDDGEEWSSPYEADFDPPLLAEPVLAGGPGVAGGPQAPGGAAKPQEGVQPPAEPGESDEAPA